MTPCSTVIDVPSAGQKLVVKQLSYVSGGVAFRLYTLEGEEWLTLSVNIQELVLGPDEFAVKDYSENAPYVADILNSGLFEDTGRRAVTGFVEVPIWRTK